MGWGRGEGLTDTELLLILTGRCFDPPYLELLPWFKRLVSNYQSFDFSSQLPLGRPIYPRLLFANFGLISKLEIITYLLLEFGPTTPLNPINQ